jgi:hypothetical protein
MTTAYSVGYTKYNAAQMTDPEWGTPVRFYYDEYEASSLAAASTIHMFLPPKGTRYAGMGQLAWDDLSGTSTYTLSAGVSAALDGTVADVDAFVAATSAVAAADKVDLDAGAIAITMLGYEFDGGTSVTITTAGSATDATGTIKLGMFMFNV